MKKQPFRLSPYQVQWLLVVGFLTVGYAIYLRYLAIENSQVALACDAGLQTWLCKTRLTATWLFRHSVFGGAAITIAVLHVTILDTLFDVGQLRLDTALPRSVHERTQRGRPIADLL